MTGKASSDNDWTAMWSDAQRHYWQSWLDLSRNLAPGKPPEPPPSPWAQSFDYWSKLMPSALPPESRDWATKLTDINKGYLQLGEGLWKTLTAAQGTSPEQWTELVGRGFKEMQDKFAAGLGGHPDPWAGFATFWGMPVDTWRRVCSACSILPGDMEKALRGFGEGPDSALGKLFSLPTLGYTREWQEEVQRWGQLWTEHHEALRRYATDILAKISQRAAERLTARLQENTPNSLREFYNLWVDCGEEAYAEAASTPDFVQAQAALVNTLMAVKRQEQKMVDETLSALNMPTRRELDTSHQRIHNLQRQVWQLREELDTAGILALREEVAALRRELETLNASPAPKRATKPQT